MATSVPSHPARNCSPLARGHPPLEVVFPHRLDPLGQIHGWLGDYTFPIPSPIIHICDDDLHVGIVDLSATLKFTDRVGILTISDVICFLGHFMTNDLAWENYQTLDDDVKRCVSLAFKRRVLGSAAQEGSHSGDWEAFMRRCEGVLQHPRNSDLFLGRRSAWRFTVWADYSILWVTDECPLSPES